MMLGILSLMLLDATEAEARRGRGGSFGGSRRSYRSAPSRPSAPRTSSPSVSSRPRTRSSFGGSRLRSSQEYTRSYGTPRRTERVTAPSLSGGGRGNYVVNRYGGMSDGLMLGYLMGSTSMWWSTPFHPAFYHSRPYYVTNPDGSTGVYPPTFSWGKVIVMVVVVGGVSYVVYRVIRRRRENAKGQMAQSSFS